MHVNFGSQNQIIYVKCSIMVCCRVAHNVGSNLKKMKMCGFSVVEEFPCKSWVPNPNFYVKLLYNDMLSGFTDVGSILRKIEEKGFTCEFLKPILTFLTKCCNFLCCCITIMGSNLRKKCVDFTSIEVFHISFG